MLSGWGDGGGGGGILIVTRFRSLGREAELAFAENNKTWTPGDIHAASNETS